MPLKRLDPFVDPLRGLDPKKNPYVEKFAEAPHSLISGEKLRGMAGNWSNQSPVVLEIGCHLGKTLIEAATRHPEIMWLGMDITLKRVVTVAQRIEQKKLSNAQVIYANGRSMQEFFAPAELDGIMIFFPDPWPKKKHAHNRLLEEKFIMSLATLIKPSGSLWFKTDSESYFHSACAIFQRSGFSPATYSLFHTIRSSGDLVTTFQQRFALANIATYEMIFSRIQ